MRQFPQSLALFLAGGILLGSCASRCAADASTVAEKDISRLIGQLGSERFQERENATQELSRLGKSALPGLKKASNSPDAEVRRRAGQLIRQMEPPPVRVIPFIKSYL
jgi:hypothetical protein